MSESVHKFVHEGYGTKVKITTQDVSLSGILETFTHYLKACGFSMDGRSVEAVIGAQLLTQHKPIFAGQHDIQKNHVGNGFFEHRERFLRAFGCEDIVSFAFQRKRKKGAHGLIVIHNHDHFWHTAV